MCPFHQKGQVLYSDGINPPDGMCGVAWQVIAPMARQLSLGELVQPSGTWLNDDTIGVFACPDGIRPVIHDNRMLAERAFYCLCRRRHKVARIAEQNRMFCSRFLKRKAPAEWRLEWIKKQRWK